MRKEIDLSLVESLVSYDKDTGIFTSKASRGRRKAGTVLIGQTDSGYVRFRLAGNDLFAHRLAFLIVYGESPDYIDHINGIRNDNRISNLRAVSPYGNSCNSSRKKNGSSRFKGVSWKKDERKWTAQIRVFGDLVHLGYYENESEAAYRYDVASLKYHGKIGKRNFLPFA